ncbi:alpha/beta hydrolase [Lipingzhangella sp. LS1_29]|uniref:Alpha/beta hydrolase n=1 Tax=Lipingzhangella rawalii TaxID=2055835 RepID=A0ABU2H407_9ACTN|nr:alpha/beta hydrolase [Lipingzhangella rawalii]MDS1270038.1 alpha/beta hydrolase [Lipingzhangella rawalii]
MVAESTLTRPLTGVAAGVPYLAVPPPDQNSPAPVVVAWHAFEPPRSEAALAGTLPLSGLNAWRFYLGLPLFGSRLPAGGVAEINRLGHTDYLNLLFGPVVEQAAAELAYALHELREWFPVHDGPIGVLGAGAGGTVALLAALESQAPIGAVGVVNPIIEPTPVLEARRQRLGVDYSWTPRAREVAARLDFTRRAEEFTQPSPLLLVTGGQDEVIVPQRGQSLHEQLAPHFAPGTLRHLTIPELAHTMGPEPGLDPGPATPATVLTDRALVEWLHLHLASGAATTHTLHRPVGQQQ